MSLKDVFSFKYTKGPTNLHICGPLVYNDDILINDTNIILQTNIDFNNFKENYQEFLDGLDTDEIKKDHGFPENDRLKKNGTFNRGLYFHTDIIVFKTRIKIQKLERTTIINGEEVKIYMSVFPDFIRKYTKASLHIIEFITINVGKGEDIFTVLDDPENYLHSEDPLHNSCHRIDQACFEEKFAALLNAYYTEIHDTPISLSATECKISSMRYSNTYELFLIGQGFTGKQNSILATLNRRFNFLR